MADREGFAFFCDDVRSEAANKTSYMGVLGPHITLDPFPADAPPDARPMLKQLVAVGMFRTTSQGPLLMDFEIVFENAPEGVIPRIESKHEVAINQDYDGTLAQFNAILPNIPAEPGMTITANFSIEGQSFGATLTMHAHPDDTRYATKKME